MRHFFPCLSLICALLTLVSCQDSTAPSSDTDATTAATGVTFASVVNHYDAQTLLVPEGCQVDILYQGAIDSVMTDEGVMRLSKKKIDFLAFVPLDSSSAYGQLFMNHELRDSNSVLGDGGGMSWLEIRQVDGHWQQVSDAHYIDFAPLGGTWHNCGGEVTPHGTILTAEEYPPFSNEELYAEGRHFRDTSDVNGLRRHENMGWMVEVDIATKRPLHKLWQMGRYSHEDTYATPDGKTVYLTDDYGPAVFFKFEATTPYDYTEGQLYAYQQSEDGQSGQWLAMPMEQDSLIHARAVAMRQGATMFKSHEWIDAHDGRIIIAESGGGHNYGDGIAQGATLAHHLRQAPLAQGEHRTQDWFGRLLVFDPETNQMSVFLEGGEMPDGGYLSAPDGLLIETIQGQPYVFVCEDASIGSLEGAQVESWEQKKLYLELYMIPIGADGTAQRDGIKRLAVGPEGCEMTGLAFTPDKKTLFLSVQHPSSSNPAPYTTSTIVALAGIF